jgi:RimJ/RimL family protein N-acetyltransferase
MAPPGDGDRTRPEEPAMVIVDLPHLDLPLHDLPELDVRELDVRHRDRPGHGRPSPGDGSTLWFHRAAPTDTDALHDLYVRLSPEARRRRFFQPMPRVRRSTASHLCSVDPARHLVWLARDGGSTGAVVGEVQAAVDRNDPTVAEIALAVDDRWTGRGVGRLLVTLMHDLAARHGIETFTAEVLSENRPCIDLLSSFGMRFQFASGLLEGRGPVRPTGTPAWTATVGPHRHERLARSA